MKILLTGSHGYIGSLIHDRLNKEGHEVGCVDLKIDREVRSYLDMTGVDLVIHCAAISNVVDCKKDPMECFGTNVGGTHNVLSAMKYYNVPHIIFLSTAAIDADNPYSISKKNSEDMIRYSGLKYHNLRLYNVEGGLHKSETHLVPNAINAAMNGTELQVSNLNAVRDYIHPLDVVQGIIEVIDNNPASGVYYMGTGKGYSNRDIIKKIENKLEKEIKVVNSDLRVGEPDSLVARVGSNNLQHSDIDNIIESAINAHNSK